MPSKDITLRHTLEGGWATDFGPMVMTPPQQDGSILVPFLADAQNMEYVMPRGVRKIGGTAVLNSATLGSATTNVMGLHDYWRMGTSGTPTRKKICHAGTVLYADNDDNVFASIATGLEADKVPFYCQFYDKLVISSNSTVDVPLLYDQTTCAALTGSPPAFQFSCHHVQRLWAAGVAGAPSTVYYTGIGDETNWSGAGSGSIDVQPGDGDKITALISYKGDLWVFKGPNKGSIHRISGNTVSTFSLKVFIQGLGAAGPHCVAPYGDDVAFVWSTGTVHSLKATASYGDYNQAFLTQPIDTFIRNNINHSRTSASWLIDDIINSRLLLCTSYNAYQYNGLIMAYDYRFSPGRWSRWDAYNAQCLGYFIEGGAKDRRIYVGGTDGQIRRTNMPSRNIDGSGAISASAVLPTFTYGSSSEVKILNHLGLGVVPTGNYNANVYWSRDGKSQQSTTVSLQGGDTIGNNWAPGVSTLGGLRYTNNYADAIDGDEFRGIQYQITNTSIDQEMEVHDLQATITFTGQFVTENS